MSVLGGLLAMWLVMAAVAAAAWIVTGVYARRDPATIEHEYRREGEQR